MPEGVLEQVDAEVGVDAGEEFGWVEGLGDVVDGAEFEAFDNVFGFDFGREEDDGNVSR